MLKGIVRRLKAVYGTFCVLGVATLLPWNCMISNANFFEVRLRNAPQALAGSFEAAVTVVFQVTCVPALYAPGRCHSQ